MNRQTAPGAVALVTGAGRGIGQAIALRLAQDGYNIALNDICQSHELEATKKEIKSMGREVVKCIADISKEIQVKDMVGAAVKDLGGLDVVCTLLSHLPSRLTLINRWLLMQVYVSLSHSCRVRLCTWRSRGSVTDLTPQQRLRTGIGASTSMEKACSCVTSMLRKR